MTFRRQAILFVVLILLSGCARAPTAPNDPAVVKLNGSVTFVTVEGGFWAVRGDDGVTYDPVGGLPAQFQRDRLRVYFEARRRDDLGGIHMVGPIVEILLIRPI